MKRYGIILPGLIIVLFAQSCAPQTPVSGTTAEPYKAASSGFPCPKPQFPAEISSEELNIYVWTEYLPAEGAILWQDNWALLTNAPNADAAYAWLNYINQGDVFWLVLKEFPYTNPNLSSLEFALANEKDLYYAYIDSPISNTPLQALKNGHRISDVGDAQQFTSRLGQKQQENN